MSISIEQLEKKDRDIILNAVRMGVSPEDIATLVDRPVKEIESMHVSLLTVYEYTKDVAENCYLRGVEEGKVKGENRLGRLISRLFSEGHTVDAQRAATDEKVRRHFFKKYRI